MVVCRNVQGKLFLTLIARMLKSSFSAICRCSTLKGNDLRPRGKECCSQKTNQLQQQEMVVNGPVLVILGLDGVQLLAASFTSVWGKYGKYSEYAVQVALCSCSRLHRWVSSDLASAFTAHTLKGGINDTVLGCILPREPRTILRPPTLHMNLCREDNELLSLPLAHRHIFIIFLHFISHLHPGQRHSGLEADRRRSLGQTASVQVCTFVRGPV